MILLLLSVNIHCSLENKKQTKKKLLFNNGHIKLNDGCFDTNGDPISGGVDDTTCPQAYLNLYITLPAETPPTDELDAYNTACLKTGCAENCHDFLFPSSGTPTFDETFKASFKSKCIPPGAGDLFIDICTKGDDTKATGLKDNDDCVESYEKLLNALPDTANPRNKSSTLLAGEAAALEEFSTKCKNTICSKDACYSAIIKTVPTEFNSVLKDTISKNCNPITEESQGGENYGFVYSKCNQFILLFGFVLISFNFWL
jgi:hypothetical protein